MQLTGDSVKAIHVWYITKYDTSRWIEQPVIFEHYDFRDKSEYLSENYVVPILALKVEGSPLERFKELSLILQQRYRQDTSDFYLTECEVPYNIVKGNKKVLMPYLATLWIRGVTKFEHDNTNTLFRYKCITRYESIYKTLLSGLPSIECSEQSIQNAFNIAQTIKDPDKASTCIITNHDMIRSIATRAQDFEQGSKELSEILPRLQKDAEKPEIVCFKNRNKVELNSIILRSYEYLWRMFFGYKRDVVKEYQVDTNNIQKYILDANKMLKQKAKDDAKEAEKRKEKERIRKEKEEIERKKEKYGEENVDDRIKLDEDSFAWWLRWFGNKITFGRIAPPKTLRSEDYRKEFIKHNPGLFINGLYFCIYCGRPILADTQNKYKKMYVDHIKPINQGGRNSVWNLGPACLKCNTQKSDKGGEWVLSGYLGKIGFSAIQTVSSVSKTLLFGLSSKSKFKKLVSAGFYITTGLWMLKLLF